MERIIQIYVESPFKCRGLFKFTLTSLKKNYYKKCNYDMLTCLLDGTGLELIVYLVLYFIINIVYRTVLEKDQQVGVYCLPCTVLRYEHRVPYCPGERSAGWGLLFTLYCTSL